MIVPNLIKTNTKFIITHTHRFSSANVIAINGFVKLKKNQKSEKNVSEKN